MIKTLRTAYNEAFTPERYNAFLEHIYALYDHKPGFRISETPVFIPDGFRDQLVAACDSIIDVIQQPDFKAKTQGSLPPAFQTVPEGAHPHFLVIDFGICEENGQLVPKMIEMQGFPSLYFFQHDLALAYQRYFDLPEDRTHLFNGLDTEGYINILRRVIVGTADPASVVLLEVEPELQNTQIDFWGTAKALGIKVLCLTKVIKEGRQLFYEDEKGDLVRIERIYNRVIFDELDKKPHLTRSFDFTDDLDVVWVGHPNWFFRISKYTMPFIDSPFVPKTYFLDQLTEWPSDLQQYVLKPLFSFSGQGVKININADDLAAVDDKSNHILQEKVNYAPILETPSGPTKVEIRLLFVWEDGADRPLLVNNLIRLSKGEMIGVRYNKDKDWVGASVGLFSKP